MTKRERQERALVRRERDLEKYETMCLMLHPDPDIVRKCNKAANDVQRLRCKLGKQPITGLRHERS